jgi:stearoyl-CoA desaturase (delta-9 desaturase)
VSTAETTYPFIGKNLGNQIGVTLATIIPLAATLTALLLLFGSYASWLDIWIMIGMHIVGGLGISLGYHRLTTHGAFKARKPAQAVLVWAGIQSLQGGPASWAATHRRHHSLADKPGDPHSPLEGLWHAHMGWLWKGNLVHDGPAFERLMRDPVIRFFEKTQALWYALTFLIPGAIAFAIVGTPASFWQAVLWGGAVRIFLMHHITWSINSICHAWGTRPYDSPDVARNNVIFGVLGYGEGWHNNHHAFPNSAYLGHRWYQFDLGKYALWVLRPLGLVYDLVIPSRDDRKRRSVKHLRSVA